MSEWKVDDRGKRYRMIGNVKEYEMMVVVDGGIQVPASQLNEYNRMKQENAAREIENSKKDIPQRSCPFKTGINSTCRESCMLFTNQGCSLVYMVDRAPAAKSPAGHGCPFNSYNCRGEYCSLWHNGCIFTAI